MSIPDWGNVLALTQAQVDAITSDPDIADTWRRLSARVLVHPEYLGQHEQPDGSIIYQAAHHDFDWGDAELLLELCDSKPARDEAVAERAKGGDDWAANARARARARVEAKSDTARARAAADNKTRRDGGAPAQSPPRGGPRS